MYNIFPLWTGHIFLFTYTKAITQRSLYSLFQRSKNYVSLEHLSSSMLQKYDLEIGKNSLAHGVTLSLWPHGSVSQHCLLLLSVSSLSFSKWHKRWTSYYGHGIEYCVFIFIQSLVHIKLKPPSGSCVKPKPPVYTPSEASPNTKLTKF